MNKYSVFIYLFCLSSLLAITSCSKESAQETTIQNEEVVASEYTIPQASDSLFYALITKCDYIDIVFHSLPMSISLDNDQDVKRFFTFFKAEPLTMKSTCNPNASIAFLGNGELIKDSQLHFSVDCRGLVFLKNQKPHSGIPLNVEGIKYFSNLINQGKQIFEENYKK